MTLRPRRCRLLRNAASSCVSRRQRIRSMNNSLRAQQYSTRAAFFIPGFALAAWAPIIPYVKARAGLDDAVLGMVLLCLGAGSLLSMPLAGAWTARHGCKKVLIATTVLICATFPVLSLVSSTWLLGAALFCF